MTLLYLHQHFKNPQEFGGTRSYDLASSFVKMGISVHVLTATSDIRYHSRNSRWKVSQVDGIHVHHVYLPYSNHMSYGERIWVFLQFLGLSTMRCLSLDCDIVLATSTPLTIGIPALVKRFFHRVPYVFEVRDVWPEAVAAVGAIKSPLLLWLLERFEWLIYRFAVTVVPLSTDMRKSICSRFPEFTEKTSVVIENISEVQRFDRDRIEGGETLANLIGRRPRFIVLYAGTLGTVNGLSYMVDLAGMTMGKDSEIVFVAIGDGTERQELVKRAHDSGVLGRNMFFMEPVAKEILPELYYEADMGSSFVINIEPLWANSANKFFDTLAAGKPVLINHGGWQSEVIESSQCGFVLPPILSDDFVNDFVQYTQNSKLVEEHGKNALRVANERYSLPKAVRSYMDVFSSITG